MPAELEQEVCVEELKVTGYPYIFSVIYLSGNLILDKWTLATIEFQVETRGTVEMEVNSISVGCDPKDVHYTKVSIQGTLDDRDAELHFWVRVERKPDPKSRKDKKSYQFSRGILSIH